MNNGSTKKYRYALYTRIEVDAAVARVARNTINQSNSDRHKATSAEGSNLFPRNWNQTND